MYPYIRTIRHTISASFKDKVKDEHSVTKISTRVWFSDIDLYPELNNGRHLSIMDLGRYCHGIQMGLFAVLRKNKWGLMVAGNFTRYRRRIKLLQKFTIETEIVGYDDRWFYFYQKNVRKGVIHSSALIRTAITSKDGLVPSKNLVDQMGFDFKPHIPDWVEKWIELNEVSPEL